MIRIFENMEEYNTFTHNGKNMVSGDLYWVKENKRAFFLTNNIDGEIKSYDMMGEIPEGYIVPSGNIAITENGEGIDVTQYATATVNVPSTGGAEDLISFIEGKTTTLTIPEGTTTISSNIFQNYTKLLSVIIPDSVKFINMNAFDGCTSLTDATIGSGVTKISYYAFQNCSSLTSITILATKPPMLNADAFKNTNNCPIYVPAASVDAYKTATNWSKYASRIYAIGTEVATQPDGPEIGGPEIGGPDGPEIEIN